MTDTQLRRQATEQHRRILRRLTDLESGLAALGRFNIVVRHQPRCDGPSFRPVSCAYCSGYGDTPTEWPCPDYRDAAADLFPKGSR